MSAQPSVACGHAHQAGSREPARARLLAGLAAFLLASPLLVSRLIDPAIAGQPGGCPLLHATGVPCPACGATRAFVLFAHGDLAGALRFNWSWLVIWAVAVVALGVAAWRSSRGRVAVPDPLRRAGRWLQAHPAAVVILPFALMLGPWLVAMANLGAIR